MTPAERDTFTTYDGSEYTVLERPEGSDGALVMRFVLRPDCGAPPPHVHPHTVEVFEVTEGEFELLVDHDWMPVRAGESVSVAPGQRHTFRNRSGANVIVRNVHDPHHDFERYIRRVAQLSQDLETVAPSGPGAVARMSLLWNEHSDLIQAADAPMKVGMKAMGTAARLLRLDVPS